MKDQNFDSVLPEKKEEPNMGMLFTYCDVSCDAGFNDCREETRKRLEKVITQENIEKALREHFDSFFKQVHFYVEVQGWYNEGIKKTATAIRKLLMGSEG